MINTPLRACLKALNLDQESIRKALQPDLELEYTSAILSLKNKRSGLGTYIDFLHGPMAHRSRQHAGAEKLIKACKVKGSTACKVLDATAGMGRDAFMLAQAGFTVSATERHPVVYALLCDALTRHQIAQPKSSRFKLFNQMAEEHMLQHDYDVVYIDPMFPEREKSAQVKKDMQLLHQLFFDQDQRIDSLLNVASRQCGKLVIKRPAAAAFLLPGKPTYQVLSKTCRFDVYQLS